MESYLKQTTYKILLISLCLTDTCLAATNVKPEVKNAATPQVERIEQNGIAVQFGITPLRDVGALKAGEDAHVEFTLTDTTTQGPITGRKPRVWIDPRLEQQPIDAGQCRKHVNAFMQGQLGSQPEADLNAYYILSLNQEPNISVIDPLLGYGGSKLLALVPLGSPGTDWTLDRQQKRLFVATPNNQQVAVVDTATWKVAATIDTGMASSRLFLQPDGKYLWTASADSNTGELAVMDTHSLKLSGHPRAGAGTHAITFSADSRQAFVTNTQDRTLSILDTQTFTKQDDIRLHGTATSLAYSPLAQAVYVVHGVEGIIEVADGRKAATIARLDLKPGLQSLSFSPDGRWGFVTNPKENHVYILDAADNHLARTVEIEGGPDRISFTANFAYVRSSASEYISLIPLNGLNQKENLSVSRFPAGQRPPQTTALTATDSVIPTPEGNAVIAANPDEKVIYYYAEGMNAPMGNFQNYARIPKALLVVDRSLREAAPGVYASTTRLKHGGTYNVAFVLDSPRVTHCFTATVAPGPKQEKNTEKNAVRIEPLLKDRKVLTGGNVQLQFKVTDASTKQPKLGLKDVGVLTLLAPGAWQQRQWARPLGEGVYEVSFVPPQSGVYYTFVQCPSLGVPLNQQPTLIMHAADDSQTQQAAAASLGPKGN
jgi:DNA-binding beta-propeller fold protein YncE